MSVDFHENLGNVLDAEKKLTCASGKIAPFAYTQEAYDCNCAEGVTEYNYGNEQNIPFGDASTLQMSGTVLAKGLRSQASSFTRMSVNHFFGRSSFNVNKLSDYMKTFLEQFLSFLESNCNEWSPTTNYVQNDVVYMMTTVNNAPAKRTFIADTASLNLPPVNNTGHLINTDKWTEVSGNVDSFRALSAEINSLTVNGISCFNGDVNANNNVNVGGNITTDHDMTVHGDLYVDGTSYVVNEAQLQVSGDYQTLRNGAESGIASDGYAGMVIENYNGQNKHSFIGVDSNGEVRVGKNAFTHSTVYTDISSFDGNWYEGLTRTLASAYPSHVFTAVTSVKLQDVAYNAIAGNQTVAGYYVLQNGTWYGNVTVSDGQFVIGNAVTDSSDIAILNTLTRNELVYYVTITDNELQGIGTNQPVMTRSETTDFADGDILMWCASEKKAVKVTRPASTNSYLKATLTNGAVSYTWESGLSVNNATCFNGCTYACAKADFRNYTPANATCFNGCTFAQACTAIRSGLTSCTGTVTVANSTSSSAVPIALCTGTTAMGRSTCKALTYIPTTGQVSSVCYVSNGGHAYVKATTPGSVVSNICNVVINAYCTNASCALTTRTWTFCGASGRMFGNVSGNTYGTHYGNVFGATVSATDPGSTASKVCNLTFQAFCTDASCVKTTQEMTFCGSTGFLTSCGISINQLNFSTTRGSYGIKLTAVDFNFATQCDAFKLICKATEFIQGKAYPVWAIFSAYNINYICKLNSTCYTFYSEGTCVLGLCSSCTSNISQLHGVFARENC